MGWIDKNCRYQEVGFLFNCHKKIACKKVNFPSAIFFIDLNILPNLHTWLFQQKIV